MDKNKKTKWWNIPIHKAVLEGDKKVSNSINIIAVIVFIIILIFLYKAYQGSVKLNNYY